jgi:hypothetical protein
LQHDYQCVFELKHTFAIEKTENIPKLIGVALGVSIICLFGVKIFEHASTSAY